MENKTDNNVTCNNSIYKKLVTLRDYWRECGKLDQQIDALEIQINILEKSASQYDVPFFDSCLEQLDHELYQRKKEIGAIILVISRTISQLPDGGGEILYQHLFLGHDVQAIARHRGTTEDDIVNVVNKCLETLVPNEVVDACGQIFKG